MRRLAILLSLALIPVAACLAAAPTASPSPRPVVAPSVLLLERSALADARDAARSERADLAPAIAELRRAADVALAAIPVAVTDKAVAPPSGDLHDYLSLSIYWWPDPAGPDGLPYVQRDGQINPESSDASRYDAPKLVRMVATVETLALAAYLTGERSYAEGAARWLRTWFLDEATRMNPTMRFAQIIPGRTQPRGTGIIDSRQLIRAVDAAILLGDGPAWSGADQASLRAWFGRLTEWLIESDQGRMEGLATNNHGSWYDVQLVVFALFAGREQLAHDTLTQVGVRRVATQIEGDGRQPRELARTRSFHYSAFNLQALCILGDLGRLEAVDVWEGSAPRLRAAIGLLVPHAQSARAWPFPEQRDIDYASELAPILARASRAYPDAGYDRVLADFAAKQTPLGTLRLRLGIFGNLGGTASVSPRWAI